jgi:hypothetical protein
MIGIVGFLLFSLILLIISCVIVLPPNEKNTRTMNKFSG